MTFSFDTLSLDSTLEMEDVTAITIQHIPLHLQGSIIETLHSMEIRYCNFGASEGSLSFLSDFQAYRDKKFDFAFMRTVDSSDGVILETKIFHLVKHTILGPSDSTPEEAYSQSFHGLLNNNSVIEEEVMNLQRLDNDFSTPQWYVFCGPSGIGKTTITQHLESYITRLRPLTKITTRMKRLHEEEKNILSALPSMLQSMNLQGIREITDYIYGNSTEEIIATLSSKSDCTAELSDPGIALHMKALFPHYVKIIAFDNYYASTIRGLITRNDRITQENLTCVPDNEVSNILQYYCNQNGKRLDGIAKSCQDNDALLSEADFVIKGSSFLGNQKDVRNYILECRK